MPNNVFIRCTRAYVYDTDLEITELFYYCSIFDRVDYELTKNPGLAGRMCTNR